MLLSIIIVSYNTKDLTRQTIESVLKDLEHSSLLQHQSEIIVVDNHSSDGSVAFLKTQFANHFVPIHFLENAENVGFARANNRALEKAQGEYVLLLNSDTIVQSGALEKMVTSFQAHPIEERTSVLSSERGRLDRLGILAAQLQNADGSLQRQGGSFPGLLSVGVHMLFLDDLPLIGQWLPSTQHTGRNTRHKSNDTQPQQQDWVGGTAMMVRREVFAEIGPLDQNIFMYAEDIEFCMRAQDHHWDVAILPSAQVTHLGSASSSSANAIAGELKGYIYIWSKHKPLWQMPFLRLVLGVGCVLRTLLFGTMLQQSEKARVYRQAARQVFQA